MKGVIKMKKKILLSLICGVLILSITTGCGKQANSNGSNDKDMQNNSSNKKYEIADDLKGTLSVNLSTTQYCLSTPDFPGRASTGYKNNGQGYFIIYDQYVDSATEVQYNIDNKDIKNSNDVIDVMKPQFIANATAVGGLIYADNYDYTITSKENLNINGYNITKFKGYFTLSAEFTPSYNTAQFVGYSLLEHGYPIYFAVIENPDEEKSINLEDMADKIIKSYRINDGDCYDD